MTAERIAFRPVDAAAAREIVRWRYPDAYAQYNQPLEETERAVAEMLRPGLRFHVCDLDGRVGGFCSFGVDGQVSGGSYDDSATDVGAGLAPDLTGQGLGPHFLSSIVHFGRYELGFVRLRATIASWNARAIRAAVHAGFAEVDAFRIPRGMEFTILVHDPGHAR